MVEWKKNMTRFLLVVFGERSKEILLEDEIQNASNGLGSFHICIFSSLKELNVLIG